MVLAKANCSLAGEFPNLIGHKAPDAGKLSPQAGCLPSVHAALGSVPIGA